MRAEYRLNFQFEMKKIVTVFVSPLHSLVADGVPWRKLIDKYLKGKERKKFGGFFVLIFDLIQFSINIAE